MVVSRLRESSLHPLSYPESSSSLASGWTPGNRWPKSPRTLGRTVLLAASGRGNEDAQRIAIIESNFQVPLLSLFIEYIYYISSRIFENVTAVSRSTVFLAKKNYKNLCKECNHCFFLFSSLSLFLLSFSFVTEILELLGLKKPAF